MKRTTKTPASKAFPNWRWIFHFVLFLLGLGVSLYFRFSLLSGLILLVGLAGLGDLSRGNDRRWKRWKNYKKLATISRTGIGLTIPPRFPLDSSKNERIDKSREEGS